MVVASGLLRGLEPSLNSRRCRCCAHKGVLRKPAVLLELYTALRHGVSIVPLCLKGGGYDFAEATRCPAVLSNYHPHTNRPTIG